MKSKGAVVYYDTFLVYDKLSANADNAIIFNPAYLHPFHISLFLLPRFSSSTDPKYPVLLQHVRKE